MCTSPGATAVAMSPAITGIVASSAFVRSWSIIGGDSSMPVTGHPSLGERDGHPAGPDGELQRPSVTGELGEAVHGRPQHLGREHAGARRVIALGGLGVPDLLLPHTTDNHHPPPSLSTAFPPTPTPPPPPRPPAAGPARRPPPPAGSHRW